MSRPRVRTKTSLLAAACLALACRTAPAPAEPERPGEGAQTTKTLAPTPEVEPIEAAKQAMELLPADTLFTIEVRGVARLFKNMGVPDVLTHGGQVGAMALVMLDGATRSIVENPERLRDWGIDPDGSAGMAVLNVPAKSLAFWMTLSDRERFQQEFETRTNKTLDFSGTRAGEIAALADDQRIIVRDGFVFFVQTQRPDLADRDLPRALADQQPRESLVHQPDYVAAVAGREAAGTVMFARPGEVMRAFIADEASEHDRLSSRMGELQWMIEEARSRGASSADLVSLESELRTVSRDATEGDRRDAKIWQQMHAFFQPIRAASVAIAFKDGEMRGDGRAVIPDPNALARRALTELRGPSPEIAAMTTAPGAIWEASFDPQAVLPIVEAMMLADRTDPDEFDQKMKDRTGVSWRDIVGQMTGEGGGGVFFAKTPSFRRGDRLEEQLDFIAYAGIKDAGAVSKTLDRFAAAKKVKKELKPKKIGQGWSFRIDDDHRAHVVVHGEHILITSDAAVAKRFAKGSPGGALGKLPEGPRADFETGGLGMRGIFDLALGFALEARRPYVRDVKDLDYRFNWYRELSPEKVEKVRMGATIKKKRKRLAGLYRKYNKKIIEVREQELQADLALAERLGHVHGRLSEGSDGFEGSLVWSFETVSLVRMALSAIDEVQSRSYATGGDMVALETEIRDLEYEIEQARYRELDLWLEKHPQAPEHPIP